MEIYCVHDSNTLWRGYYTTLERAKEVLWELYIESGWYIEDKDNPSLMENIKNDFNEQLMITDVGSIELIKVND